MKFELTISQFAYFTGSVFNSQLWGEIYSKEDLWQRIFEMESQRTFQEGWQFCPSSLVIQNQRRSWVYTTTSGTTFKVEDTRWTHDNSIFIEVDIPDDRCHPGRDHWTSMWQALKGFQFYSWYDLYHSAKDSTPYHQALEMGIVPECIQVPEPKPERRLRRKRTRINVN